jgi:hypothetical protein
MGWSDGRIWWGCSMEGPRMHWKIVIIWLWRRREVRGMGISIWRNWSWSIIFYKEIRCMSIRIQIWRWGLRKKKDIKYWWRNRNRSHLKSAKKLLRKGSSEKERKKLRYWIRPIMNNNNKRKLGKLKGIHGVWNQRIAWWRKGEIVLQSVFSR